MAYRSKQPRQLNFSGLLVKHRSDHPILETQPSSVIPQLNIYPQLGSGTTTNTDTGHHHSVIINQQQSTPPQLKLQPTLQRSARVPSPSGNAQAKRKNLSHSIISKPTNTNPISQFSLDSTSHSSILQVHPSSTPDGQPSSLTTSQPSTSQRIAFPLKPKRAYSSATVTFASSPSNRQLETNDRSPRGPRSKLSLSEHDKNYLVITPKAHSSGSSPPNSRSYFSNHSPSSTPTSVRGPSLFSLSPTNHYPESVTTHSDLPIASPISYSAQPTHFSSHYPQHLEHSTPSTSTVDLRAPSGSTSSLSSLSRTSTDHHLHLVSPELTSPWPVPPSSAHSHAPFPSGWPRKSATYYPLRTWSNAPRPDPSTLASAQKPSSALAYLDLSSTPMPLTTERSITNPQSPNLAVHSHSPSDGDSFTQSKRNSLIGLGSIPGRIRPASMISLKSNASKDTFYEDAPDKAEWMDIDSGDAYDDLEKTEDTVRKISQRLSMLNGIEAVNLAAEAKSRYHARSENGKSQDSTNLSYSTPGVRSSYSPHNHLFRCSSPQLTDPNFNPSNRDSYESSKTASSIRSHLDLDINSLRSNFGNDRFSLGGVPLFTRTSLAREDREEDRPGARKEQLRRVDDEELEAIPEAPDLESDPGFALRMTRSPSSMSGSHRRRLKPLILRSTPSLTSTTRTRTSILDSSARNSQSSGSTSPPQPIYETNSLNVSTADSWDSNHKSSDDITLKDSASSTGGKSVTEFQELPPSEQSDRPGDSAIKDLDIHKQSNNALQEPISVNQITKSPISAEVVEQAKMDEIPVIKLLNHRSSTFGMGSSNTNLMAQNQACATISKASLVKLTIDEGTPIPTETQQSPSEPENAKVYLDNSFVPKTSLKGLSPIKTQLLTSTRRRVSSHHSIQTGTCEDLTLVSASGKEDIPTSSKPISLISYRKRCISSLCMPKASPRSTDRGISAANYSAVKLAERKNSHSTISSGPKTPDTIVITGPHNHMPTDEPSLEPSSLQQTGQFSDLSEAKLTTPQRKSRLFLSLTRMQARDAKLLELTSHQAHSSDDYGPLDKAQEQSRLIRGKLKRISRPTPLNGEDERVALWGMISNAKLTTNSHK